MTPPSPANSPDDLALRDDIIHTLKDIGYPADRSAFRDCPAVIEPDGRTLRLLGHPVMERWEEPYMAVLAEIAATRATQGGAARVLEVGFGLGLSAGYVSRHAPREHVVIECNRAVADLARRFAATSPHPVSVLEGFWEDVVPTLPDGGFDGILFDTYPLSDDEVDSIFHPFVPHAHRLLRPGGVFTYYSDEAHGFDADHLAVLHASGFTKISGRVCRVAPPPGCEYWRQDTILAPVVEK